MKENTKRNGRLLVLVVLAVVLGLFAATPREVRAASDPGELAQKINNFTHGGQGDILAEVIGVTVKVTGSVTGAVNTLYLDPDEDVKVLWMAEYSGSGSPSGSLLHTTGKGTFEVAAGGDIAGSGSYTLINDSVSCTIEVSGGRILNQKEKGVCIQTNLQGSSIKITGGTVSATHAKDGRAIVVRGASSLVTVTGGHVTSTGSGAGSRAIELAGTAKESAVYVGGGDIYAGWDAIAVYAPNTTVNHAGGYTRSTGQQTGSGIYLSDTASSGKVRIMGGKVGALGSQTSHGICMDSDWSSVDISGGTVSSTGSKGGTVWIRSGNSKILLRGNGKIENTGTGKAILTENKEGNQVTVQGTSVVSAQSSQPILARLAELSGGFVFGLGSDNYGLVGVYAGKPSLSGTVIRCAWDKPGGKPVYDEESTTHLSVSPGASAVWRLKNSQTGISYKSGDHSGFFPISGITLKGESPTSATTTTTTTSTTTTKVTIEAATKTTTAETTKATTESTSNPPEESTPTDETLTSPPTTDLTTVTSPASTISEPSEPSSGGLDEEGNGGFNWLWLILTGAILLVMGGLVLTLTLIRKKARQPGKGEES